MGAKAFFNTATRTIELLEAPTNGVVSVDLRVDIYSDGKEDWELNSNEERRHRFPISTAESAGRQTTGGREEPTFFRLKNGTEGWRILPYDADHDLTIIGTIVPDDPTKPIIAARPGRTILVITDGSEVAQLTQGNTLSVSQRVQLLDIYTRLGLNPDDPFTTTTSSQSSDSGDINILISGDGVTTTTQTRQV